MAKLIIHHGTPQAHEFELKPGANHLGRGEANDCRITDGSVSTNHAQITVEGSSIRIKDLGSTNGTFINQAPVSEAVLQPGQALRLGAVSILLHTDAPVPPPPPVPVRQPINLASQATLVSSAPAPVAASGGGLKLSGLRHAEPEPPPPPSELMAAPAGQAAAVTGFAEPPPGKTACKFHPKIGGQWLCQKCSELFCPLCVTTRPSSEGTVHACRKCGTPCVPVQVQAVKSKEKKVVVYSDKMLLMRSVGFGFGAALLGALIWSGLSWLFGFDVPFLFGPMVGALVGFAVKIACQDTPGPVFSSIAVVCCIIGCVLGKVGMIAITHLTLNTNTTYVTGGLGIGIAVYTAWKIGGAE
ncbi:MAG: FHA domain-containing protein [Verrucomicrobiae bacterium]|nr:FHA domain-containing protein [Verrucomicrobiae bacterium]